MIILIVADEDSNGSEDQGFIEDKVISKDVREKKTVEKSTKHSNRSSQNKNKPQKMVRVVY